jgi:hypothetical protein
VFDRKSHPPGRAHPLDPNATYPCPCRRQGELRPITLTDAFGCQRCQQIFVIKAEGHAIEELAAITPFRRSWYWNGRQWLLIRPSFVSQYWLFVLLFALLILIPVLSIVIVIHLWKSAPLVLIWVGVMIGVMLVAAYLLRRP